MIRDPLYGKEIYKSTDRIALSRTDMATTKDLFEIVGKNKKLFKEEMYQLKRVDTGEIIEYPVKKMESDKPGYVRTVVCAELSVSVEGRELELKLNDNNIEFGDLQFEDCKVYLSLPDDYDCLKHKSDIIVKGRKPVNNIYCLERALSTLNFLVLSADDTNSVIEITILFADKENDIIVPELNLENGKKGLINLFGYRYDEVRNKNETTLKWRFDNVDVAAVLDGDMIIKLSFIEPKLLR